MKETFQLPAWLANNQPIPEELLAKRSNMNHSTYRFEYDDDDDLDSYQPSSFYGFSFIDLAGDTDDTGSIQSSNMVSTSIRDDIKTCVDSIHHCLNDIRAMNESSEPVDESIEQLLHELIDQIESSAEKNSSDEMNSIDIPLDYNLLNDLFIKKITFAEYLSLLDRLIDNKYLQNSRKSAEEISNEISSLAENIEQYRTLILIDHSECSDLDQQESFLFLPNAQSNHSVISFLQQSTSMEMSLFTSNDFPNQLSIITQQQTTSTLGGKSADIGRTVFG